MGKNFLFKSSLVLALIMAFCTKAASQSTNDIPKEGNMFYMENGKTRTVKASTRGDNDPQWCLSLSLRIVLTQPNLPKMRG